MADKNVMSRTGSMRLYTFSRGDTSSGDSMGSNRTGNASIVDYEDSSNEEGAPEDSRYFDTPAEAKERAEVIHTYTKGTLEQVSPQWLCTNSCIAGLLLGIAYAASIGGTATIIGTSLDPGSPSLLINSGFWCRHQSQPYIATASWPAVS